jgi:hypothetical protein
MNSFQKFMGLFPVKCSIQVNFILFLDVEARVGELFGQFPRAGQKNEARTVEVESANVIKIGKLSGKKFVDGFSSLRIVSSAEITFRFVEDDGDVVLTLEDLPVESNVISSDNART